MDLHHIMAIARCICFKDASLDRADPWQLCAHVGRSSAILIASKADMLHRNRDGKHDRALRAALPAGSGLAGLARFNSRAVGLLKPDPPITLQPIFEGLVLSIGLC
jgi:hypothetical protein